MIVPLAALFGKKRSWGGGGGGNKLNQIQVENRNSKQARGTHHSFICSFRDCKNGVDITLSHIQIT